MRASEGDGRGGTQTNCGLAGWLVGWRPVNGRKGADGDSIAAVVVNEREFQGQRNRQTDRAIELEASTKEEAGLR